VRYRPLLVKANFKVAVKRGGSRLVLSTGRNAILPSRLLVMPALTKAISFGTYNSQNGEIMKIRLGRELTQRYELYAKLTNRNITDAIQSALSDWMDTCGEGDIEVITGVPMDEEEKCLPFLVSQHSTSMPLVN
jgi:hypothetical protein